MLELERKTVWALYVLQFLAREKRPLSARTLARHGAIPQKELAPILRALHTYGLIQGYPGRGYSLARPAGTISVYDVAQLLESPGAPGPSCIARYEACAHRESCALAPLCREAHVRALEAMRSFSVADFRASPASLADCAVPEKTGRKNALV
jgi:Rrf2 family protein